MKSFSEFLYEISMNLPKDVRREIEQHLHRHWEKVTGKTYDEAKPTKDEADFYGAHGLESPELARDRIIDSIAGEAHKHFLETGDLNAAKKHGEDAINTHLGKT